MLFFHAKPQTAVATFARPQRHERPTSFSRRSFSSSRLCRFLFAAGEFVIIFAKNSVLSENIEVTLTSSVISMDALQSLKIRAIEVLVYNYRYYLRLCAVTNASSDLASSLLFICFYKRCAALVQLSLNQISVIKPSHKLIAR